MKKKNRFTSLILVVVMVFALSGTAFAANETTGNPGKITIKNAVSGETYTIYQILTLESYDTAKGAYAYKATTDWDAFINRDTIKGVYVAVDDQGYVTWKADADADVAEFAKAAQQYAAEKSIEHRGQANATTATVEFTGLDLGYYLLESTMGAICSLNTAAPTVIIEEKNYQPTLELQVKGDSTGNFGAIDTAQIGDEIFFKVTIAVGAAPRNYELHVNLADGLTLNPDSIEVLNGETKLTKEINYTQNIPGLYDDCDFEIVFGYGYLDTLDVNTKIVVTYSATLNGDVALSDDALTSTATLAYGDGESKTSSAAATTLRFDIVKTDSDYKLLDGAEFELYDAATGGNRIDLVKCEDGTYRVAVDGETGAAIEATGGRATVRGLDADTTYWLEETAAPNGYNKLAGRVAVKIGTESLTTTMTGETWTDGDGGVHIVNETGAALPFTGGMGTTIFYIVGAALVLGAVILLVTRKRMNGPER